MKLANNIKVKLFIIFIICSLLYSFSANPAFAKLYNGSKEIRVAIFDTSFSQTALENSVSRECFSDFCAKKHFMPEECFSEEYFIFQKCLHGSSVVEIFKDSLSSITTKPPQIYLYAVSSNLNGDGLMTSSFAKALSSFRLHNKKNKVYSIVASFGISVPKGTTCEDNRIESIYIELKAIASSGVSLFFPSGNDKGNVNWPACEKFIDAVGATQKDLFSDGPEVDYRASAEDITITDNLGYPISKLSGTSFSVPQVAALAAFVNYKRFDLLPHDLKKLINSSNSKASFLDNINSYKATSIPSDYYPTENIRLIKSRFSQINSNSINYGLNSINSGKSNLYIILTIIILLLLISFIGVIYLIRLLLNPRY